MREYTYRVDSEGRIFHDGSEIVDPATLRFFLLALRQTPDRRWLVLCQGERNWFESADTPFVVQRLGLTVAEARLRAVELHFAGDYREPLDPESLESDGGQLYCRIRKGSLSARFGKIAMQQIAPWLAGGPEDPVLELADHRYRLIPSGATPPP